MFFFSGLIIFLLVIILISCLLSSYSFSALTANFNEICVTGSDLKFKRLPQTNARISNESKQWDAEFHGQKADRLDKEFRLYYVDKERREIEEKNDPGEKTQIFQFRRNSQNALRTTTERSNESSSEPPIPSNDLNFFRNCKWTNMVAFLV